MSYNSGLGRPYGFRRNHTDLYGNPRRPIFPRRGRGGCCGGCLLTLGILALPVAVPLLFVLVGILH